MPGKLYVVATPIGNLEDTTLRAIDILKKVAVIAAEDTRHTKILLNHFAIKTPMISIHAHNEKERSHEIVNKLKEGQDIAYVTDAGTPVISDPGSHLISLVKEQAIQVSPIPGPCAAIAALSSSGLSGQKFLFDGFLSTKSGERMRQLKEVKDLSYTVVFYESPHRLLATIEDMTKVLGENRYVVIARELTKKFETIYGAELLNLKKWLLENQQQQKGEFVILIKAAEKPTEQDEQQVIKILKPLLAELPLKQAVHLTSQITEISKNKIYTLALTINQATRRNDND